MLRPFRPRRFHRAGEGLPALCRATPFRARAFRRCGGCLLLSPGTRITRLSPFARADIATTCRISCPGCNEQSTKLFAWNRKNFCVLPRTDASGRGVFALAANGSQTGEGNNQGAGSAGPRTKSKPRPRQLNG
uniref:Single-stranded DNA-binding protein n=1 Tax=Klebsiella quasipneumoniae TaxID=1463165 RepID=A0A6B7PYW6_9ENTR|nr:Single-stranded DNA-binding protein [Klebsiella quasipneumoniae]